MSENIQQRSSIKFCLLNRINATETLKKDYGDRALPKSTTYCWYKFFKDGRERVEDKERLGRPSTSMDDDHIQKVKDLVLVSRRLTIRDIPDEIGVSKESVNSILKDVLVLKRVKSQLVPKMH